MFSTLIRQQAQLASSARFTSSLSRRVLCGLPKLAQKPLVLSQRAFSVSHSLSEQGSSGRDFPRDRSRFRRRSPQPETKQSALYIGNLPYTVAEADIRDLFESYGQIKRITLASDETGRLAGFGFVEFENLDDAVAAVESSQEEPFALSNRTLRVGYARNSNKIIPDGEAPPNTTLHIPNFPLPGEEAPLRHLLQDYEGHILRINFMKNFQGNYTPKVFIQFSDQETATAVLNAFQDYNFEGTTIKMVYAKNRLPPRTSKMADFDA